MCGGRGIWEISVPYAQFCCEPKMSLKNKSVKKDVSSRFNKINNFLLLHQRLS